ncbi:MAG: hypothetical protein A2W05_09475 [Candidatus Schekmanbacteria bacterium RBG_16_38_10]|uniref:Restriction endonuclease type IV Mrr domain-containing protein n=1 Tax=Candidatus Schekmanbacteria bacterium RBG_16_38_10 TaxID=1817879 RepID=A0A1F7RUD0_9BACT|nr:MAG: hypothetical protein A2W05_09475 [Candidatus Schekmanbacteria bacterium RBG_16_38_10]
MRIKIISKNKALLILVSIIFIILLQSPKIFSESEAYPEYMGEFYFNAAEKCFSKERYSEARSYYLTIEINYKDTPFAKIAKEKAKKCWDIIRNSRELNIIEEKKNEGIIELTYEIINKSKRNLLISYYIQKGIPLSNFSNNKIEYEEYDVYLRPGQKIRENYLTPRRFFGDEEYKIDIKETMFLREDENTDVNAKPIKWGSIYQGELKLLEAFKGKEFSKELSNWQEENSKKQFKKNIIKGILLCGVIGGLIFASLRIWKNRKIQESRRWAGGKMVSENDLFGGEVGLLDHEKSLREREFENSLRKGDPAAISKFFWQEFPLSEILYQEKSNILTLKMEIEPFNYNSKDKISPREIELNYRNQLLSQAMTMLYNVFDIRIVEDFIDIVRIEFISNFIDRYGRPSKGYILSLEAPRKEVQKIVRQNFDLNNTFEIFSIYYQTDDNYRPGKVISHREIDEHKYGMRESKIEEFEKTLGLNIENLFESEYENLIKVFLENLGFVIGNCKKIGQEGICIMAYNYQPILKGKYIVFVRNHKQPAFVEIGVVRELFGMLIHESAQKGILISSSDFTKEATEFANGKPLELVNRKNLEMLLQKHVDQRYLNKMNLMVVK